jgi:lysophospholipase L1-like esterase
MKKILVAACSTVVACVAAGTGAEIWLRARGFDPLGELRSAGPVVIRRSENPNLAYELVPGASGLAWGCEVRVNADGFRDRAYARARPAGVRRIVVLGDSIAMGTGLAVEQTFPKRLEELLAPEHVEVLNLAVGGYDVLQEIAVLEQIGLAYQPDLVLVAFCINDVGVHSLNLEYIESLARYDAPVYRLRVAQWWASRSARGELADWGERVNREPEFTHRFSACIAPLDGDAELETMRRSIADYCSARAAEVAGQPFLPWYADVPKLGRLRWACERLAQLGRDHGVALEVVFLPYLKSDEHPSAYATVRGIVAHECARARLRYFDALPGLGDIELRTLRQTPQDGLHLDAAGHDLLARELKPECSAALGEKR